MEAQHSVLSTQPPPTASEVRSQLFADLMSRYVEGEPGLNEARDYTRSYRFRHAPAMRRILGVWRWRGLYDAREVILPLLEGGVGDQESGVRILDHGGGACGLGFGADVIESDAELERARGPYDVVFSSHTLEHCRSLNWVLGRLWRLTAVGGSLVLHVPAWTASHWRAGTKRKNDALHGPHCWSFCLYGDLERCPPPAVPLPFASYVGDNSILAVWHKTEHESRREVSR